MKTFKIILITIVILAFGQVVLAQKYPCLPNRIKTDTVVSATFAPPPRISKKVYVKDELKRLNARCSKGKLIDSKKLEIKFYWLTGCWGYRNPDWEKISRKQSEELAELRKKFTVITLTCNPSGVPRP
jgi:hypothetical protein